MKRKKARKIKLKTHKGLIKRIKLTATGKMMRRRAGGSHLMSGKAGKVIRRLHRDLEVIGADRKQAMKLIQNTKYAR